ncbi:hypothetical protein [Aureimonas altamirensis]|uniref:hypothetical protein n=1 Tax=Aureimonas altamirensis TaxID=370622 RepID=UPI00301B4A05
MLDEYDRAEFRLQLDPVEATFLDEHLDANHLTEHRRLKGPDKMEIEREAISEQARARGKPLPPVRVTREARARVEVEVAAKLEALLGRPVTASAVRKVWNNRHRSGLL